MTFCKIPAKNEFAAEWNTQ